MIFSFRIQSVLLNGKNINNFLNKESMLYLAKRRIHTKQSPKRKINLLNRKWKKSSMKQISYNMYNGLLLATCGYSIEALEQMKQILIWLLNHSKNINIGI